jgi:hypothetical protein
MLGDGPYAVFSRAQTKSSADKPQMDTIQISIECSGGYAGTHELFNIYPNGRITNAAGQAQQVPVQALESVRRKAETLDIPKSCDIRVSEGLCSDCFQYRIIFFGSSGMKRTLIIDDPINGSDSVSKVAKEVRDLVLDLKWK